MIHLSVLSTTSEQFFS